jgi:hypothetical protein
MNRGSTGPCEGCRSGRTAAVRNTREQPLKMSRQKRCRVRRLASESGKRDRQPGPGAVSERYTGWLAPQGVRANKRLYRYERLCGIAGSARLIAWSANESVGRNEAGRAGIGTSGIDISGSGTVGFGHRSTGHRSTGHRSTGHRDRDWGLPARRGKQRRETRAEPSRGKKKRKEHRPDRAASRRSRPMTREKPG